MAIRKVQLNEVFMARAGDKGDIINIGLMAPNYALFEIIKEKITEERVSDYFKDMITGGVKRYEIPNLLALNFVLFGALDGGAQQTLRVDALGKCYSAMLCKMEIEIEDKLLEEVEMLSYPG